MAIDFGQLQYVDIGQRFTEGLQAARQQQAMQEKQQQAQMRAQQMQQDVAAWRGSMSPEATADLLLRYPEIKDQITSAQSVLSEAAKQDRVNFNGQVLMLSRSGQDDRVREKVEQRVGAYRAAGKEKEAQEAEAMLKAWELDRKAGEGLLVLDVANANPDLYKTVFGAAELTPMEKQYNAIAARNGKAEADAWFDAQVTKDKLIPVAGVGLFDASNLGGQSPESLPRVTTKAEADALKPGTRFIAPDGSVKVKAGGAGSNAGGSFRPAGN